MISFGYVKKGVNYNFADIDRNGVWCGSNYISKAVKQIILVVDQILDIKQNEETIVMIAQHEHWGIIIRKGPDIPAHHMTVKYSVNPYLNL